MKTLALILMLLFKSKCEFLLAYLSFHSAFLQINVPDNSNLECFARFRQVGGM